MEHHSKWQTEIRKRSASLESDWWPFVQNINDMLDRFSILEGKIHEMENKLGETQGMIKNLRKILIKLEVIDDRFIF